MEKNSAGKLRKVDKKYVVADTRKILGYKVGEPESNLRNILNKIYMERKVTS